MFWSATRDLSICSTARGESAIQSAGCSVAAGPSQRESLGRGREPGRSTSAAIYSYQVVPHRDLGALAPLIRKLHTATSWEC